MKKSKWTNKQLEKMTEEELEALNDSGRLSHKRYYKECMRRHIEEQTELYKNKRTDTSHYSFFWILLSGQEWNAS